MDAARMKTRKSIFRLRFPHALCVNLARFVAGWPEDTGRLEAQPFELLETT
jgi:hypothetical protein